MLEEALVSIYSAPVIIALILLEVLYSHYKRRKLYSAKDTATNFYLMGLAILLNLAMKGVQLLVFGYLYQFKVFQFVHPVAYWVGLLIIQDFLFYFLHYVDHYSRFFWAIHVTHHNSENFNFSVGFRSSVFQPLYRFVYYLPLPFLGFHPMDILGMYALVQIWGIFVHTQSIKKLPRLIEFVFVTPSHHRVHHASNIRYLDKNMGMFLIIWDRFFGTFQEELESDPVRYGLTTNPAEKGPLNIVFHEFYAIQKDVRTRGNGLIDKLKYIFAPPGWSHDGSTKTSRELRSELYEQELRMTSNSTVENASL